VSLVNGCAYVGQKNYIWHMKEPVGHSRGILLGVDLDVCDIGGTDKVTFM
jgi:hypothetical protein